MQNPKRKNRTSFWLDPGLLDRMRAQAAKERRSMAVLLTIMIEEGLASRKRKQPTAAGAAPEPVKPPTVEKAHGPAPLF